MTQRFIQSWQHLGIKKQGMIIKFLDIWKNLKKIHHKPEEDSGAGRRAGVINFCDWSTCYINDRTKKLDLQGIRCYVKDWLEERGYY